MQRLRKTRGTDIDLGMLFDLYLESENTDYNCPKCKAKHGRNTTKFWRFPDVLILQLVPIFGIELIEEGRGWRPCLSPSHAGGHVH